ncbi:sugar phosphate nucleotidyltransferase [Falsirhodobacter xinxiangensis]|uniref:sugar phosphate nucleotidyltransferase n=1 Tax=Falsirhodobacter xinxiangensis TaxID=2530049 RepID=UPI0010AA8DA5|nr:sugar phosphate nucleotidyltransferase [Rhodobacter xinxiangensis]
MTARSDDRTLAILLAGGQGSRLHELTASDCKPALHMGEGRRIVDFTMANAVSSGIDRMLVATQYRPASLEDHLPRRWGHAFRNLSLRHGPTVTGSAAGYVGTAAAVAANMAEIDASGAEEVLILAGDHVYDMDYAAMIAQHRETGAAVTVAVDAVPLRDASAFGVLHTDAEGRVLSFLEKPALPPHMPGDPSRALASMGIYVFSWNWLRAALMMDAMELESSHDFGHDILPAAVDMGIAFAHRRPMGAYWRDVGTLDAFRRTALDLRDAHSPCRLPDRIARADLDPGHDGWVGHSVTISGISLMAPRSAGRWTLLDETVILPGARVETGARLTRAIVAPGTVIPSDLTVGEDPTEDARWFRRTPGGTTLITQDMLARRDARALVRPAAAMVVTR